MERMSLTLNKTTYWRSETSADRLPEAMAEVTFVGRSNAGKSSLICALCENSQLARISKRPGRTRAINIFEATRGRWLVDLPGYGFAEGPERERNY
jgi:GTP-binding protein